jgi:hypothetical protein
MGVGFTKTDNPGHEGKTNVWLTPRSILDRLGNFDLDPCAARGWPTALDHYYDHGLEREWTGRIWCNPPYGKHTKDWLDKMMDHGNGIALVFARTDTKWFQSLRFDAINFISGRVTFLKPDLSTDTNAGAPSCLIAWGNENIAAIKNVKGMVFKYE